MPMRRGGRRTIAGRAIPRAAAVPRAAVVRRAATIPCTSVAAGRRARAAARAGRPARRQRPEGARRRLAVLAVGGAAHAHHAAVDGGAARARRRLSARWRCRAGYRVGLHLQMTALRARAAASARGGSAEVGTRCRWGYYDRCGHARPAHCQLQAAEGLTRSALTARAPAGALYEETRLRPLTQCMIPMRLVQN